MPKYLEIAGEANETARDLLDLVPEPLRVLAATKIARLINYGLRMAPRPVQSTVRLRAVERSVEGLPVRISMKEVERPDGSSYKILETTPIEYG